MTLRQCRLNSSGSIILIARIAHAENLSPSLQSALSTLASIAGGLGEVDCIHSGRVQSLVDCDAELADLLHRALEALDGAIH
jgi:hypothetical protein